MTSHNIYFAGSIGGGRQDADVYAHIVDHLKENYGRVFSEHVASPDPTKDEVDMSDRQIHDRNINWLKESDVVVAECTVVSHGVGYEIGRAVGLNKKILCLFRPGDGKKLSAMIRGAENGTTVTCKDYRTKDDLPEILKNFFDNL